ncbi:glutathione S-transferase family protein [Alteraurantiacibacter aquimixticola]|uniref:Glutathione S-transferase family protein n=1 Tax=Alteraurantiacibacter aquimixticola TaxID=2489173 RepID=A0A4T3F542_9SPHN|nr:glutathione S-transferase family protein [Alteraurantiacibacter aquimixticola]TIX50628.1 glutathione S-transferase family protein [Alteraurantiacibacter aquimixticola]
MITIYHVPNSRSQRVVWLMEEMGESYKLETFGIPVPEDFLKVNPLGSVPTIVDDDADAPITQFESLAILQYLTGRRLVAGNEAAIALTTGPLPDPAAYAEHLQFLHFGEADLATPVGTIFRTRIFTGEQTNNTIADQLSQLEKRLAFLDRHLADGREWVTGERFTIADISIGYAFLLAEFTKCEVALPAHVAAYWQRLQARPAFKRTQAA